ncbi:phage tail protein [Oxalobacteraceae bacterium]|nr:phage tail protein [Oxalobacteraceae bacterium]
MSVSLPNGIILSLATAYASSLTVTAASNAAECVLTVTNTLAAGDIVELISGWSRANNRLFRVKSPTGANLVLEGFDTTSTTQFPAGSGTGTIRKINSWTQIQQVMDLTSSGGEPQYQTYSFLEDDYDRQIPTTTSAQSLAINIADDPTLGGYQAMKAAALSRTVTGLRGALPQGGFLFYNGIVAFDETPSMSKGNVMQCKGGFALQGKPVRYAT